MDCGTGVDIGDPPPYVGEVKPFPNPPNGGTIVLTGFGEGVEADVGNKPRMSSIAFRGFGGEAEVAGVGVWVVDVVVSVAAELPKISSSRF